MVLYVRGTYDHRHNFNVYPCRCDNAVGNVYVNLHDWVGDTEQLKLVLIFQVFNYSAVRATFVQYVLDFIA